jgi:hypothetical protein
VAAWHLKALIEAEIAEPRMLGVMRAAPPADILAATVQRGLEVWLRAYGPASA